jgi:hypothetical protein
MCPTMNDRSYLLVLAALLCMGSSYTIPQAMADYDFTCRHGIVWC